MPVYLGLGSNQGDRREHLERAIAALVEVGVAVDRVSPIVESPALLPDDAPPEWNRPFLNLVLECTYDARPAELLGQLKAIESRFGRVDARRWSPRPIDIDILLWHGRSVIESNLSIPHPALTERAFVMSPLAALAPGLRLPGDTRTVLERARLLAEHIPLWMGIVNLTPDSFSDGGRLATWDDVERHVDGLVAGGAQILDFGAESTRPGATPLTPNEELDRLVPVLERVMTKYAGDLLKPLISVDTYHPAVARRALDLGVDVINDVSGLATPDMLEVAASSEAQWIAMHQLSLPADPGTTLATDIAAIDQIEAWLDAGLETWARAGIDTNRIVFDPGVGFGKNPLQSLELLRHVERLQRYGLRLLVGHSRKSFMHRFAGRDERLRDLATIGASLRLCTRNVEILRVHDVAGHAAAYGGWAHLA
jgi:2-amino-4-hydroxy-6-hydroxymethyldihydropteridine diphosphokinase / dihydropteroate synthase